MIVFTRRRVLRALVTVVGVPVVAYLLFTIFWAYTGGPTTLWDFVVTLVPAALVAALVAAVNYDRERDKLVDHPNDTELCDGVFLNLAAQEGARFISFDPLLTTILLGWSTIVRFSQSEFSGLFMAASIDSELTKTRETFRAIGAVAVVEALEEVLALFPEGLPERRQACLAHLEGLQPEEVNRVRVQLHRALDAARRDLATFIRERRAEVKARLSDPNDAPLEPDDLAKILVGLG